MIEEKERNGWISLGADAPSGSYRALLKMNTPMRRDIRN